MSQCKESRLLPDVYMPGTLSALVLSCVLEEGHDGPHQMADGERWYLDGRGVVVQTLGRLPVFNTVMRVKVQ